MAILTDTFVAIADGFWIDITYDDTNAVVDPETGLLDLDLCDIEEMVAHTTGADISLKIFRKNISVAWQAVDVVAGTPAAFILGPVKVFADIDRFEMQRSDQAALK